MRLPQGVTHRLFDTLVSETKSNLSELVCSPQSWINNWPDLFYQVSLSLNQPSATNLLNAYEVLLVPNNPWFTPPRTPHPHLIL